MPIILARTGAPDGVAKLMPPELAKAVAKINEISSLPEITTRIVEVVEDPHATARNMHDVVQGDPALTAKILKVVNSAFYGLQAQIASLDRAILMLGLSAVKNIALATSLSRMFKAEAVSEQFTARDLWRHSVAVGVCSRQLAQAVRSDNPDEVFVAGLVHDMGLIVCQQLFPEKLRQVAETCLSQPQDFRAVEERIVGADHQQLGGLLAAKWKFPLKLLLAIGSHHELGPCPDELKAMVAITLVADTTCCRDRYGFWLTAQTQKTTNEMLQLIGLSAGQLDRVRSELPLQVEEAEHIFAG